MVVVVVVVVDVVLAVVVVVVVVDFVVLVAFIVVFVAIVDVSLDVTGRVVVVDSLPPFANVIASGIPTTVPIKHSPNVVARAILSSRRDLLTSVTIMLILPK